MKTFARWLGATVTLLAITLPFLAVWLTAHQLILSRTESVICIFSWLAAVIGPVLFWTGPRKQKVSHFFGAMVLAAFCSAIALTIVLMARRYSDRMFSHFLMARTPGPAWQQMVSDVSDVGRAAATQSQFGIVKQLPKSLDWLGRPEETSGVNVLEFEKERIGIVVAYGGRNRRWGLLVGPDEFLNYFTWKKYTHIPVSTNAVFFVGPDW